MTPAQGRPRTLYLIIGFKLVKATLLLLVGFGVLSLADKDVPELLLQLVQWAHLNVESKVIAHFIAHVREITPRRFEWIATGSMISGSLHLSEGIGLWFRKKWAAWLAMVQCALLIPLEIYELQRRFHYGMLLVLVINLGVLVYLYLHRHSLFDHAEKKPDQGAK